MSILIDIRMSNWMTDQALKKKLIPLLPDVEIHCGPPEQVLADVTMLATNRLFPGVAEKLPNLQLIQKLGAGVETMMRDTSLPDRVRVARLEPKIQADEIAEYCLAEVLAYLRNIRGYQRDQQNRLWAEQEPRRAAETSVGVLGLGHIGKDVANGFVKNGFEVFGWSRNQKTLEGVSCHVGDDGLNRVLAKSDFVVSVLPSTEATRGFADALFFKKMKSNSVFINVGRGDLVVDLDLINALNAGRLSGATLDVLNNEPLDDEHPFWLHEKIAITPHVSGWSLGDGILDVAENYNRLIAGKPLLREIDRKLGY